MIKRTDFRFEPQGHGHYYVTYQSNKTFKKWSAVINCMPLIDEVRFNEYPTQNSFKQLIKLIKNK